jgi:hypothetical protein
MLDPIDDEMAAYCWELLRESKSIGCKHDSLSHTIFEASKDFEKRVFSIRKVADSIVTGEILLF